MTGPSMGNKRVSENVHLRRYPHPVSLRLTFMYASFPEISDALHLNIFRHPLKKGLWRKYIAYSILQISDRGYVVCQLTIMT